MRDSVAKSPDRRYASTRKVTKKTAAVPKSLISPSRPTHTPVRTMNSVKFRRRNSRSKVADPAKM
jgi:hypothetical protein